MSTPWMDNMTKAMEHIDDVRRKKMLDDLLTHACHVAAALADGKDRLSRRLRERMGKVTTEVAAACHEANEGRPV